jgi:HSP20 family protein
MVNATFKPRWSMVLPKPFDVVRDFDELLSQTVGNDAAARSWRAPVSLWEEEGRWCIEMDLPGVKQEHLDITVDKNKLRIVAQRLGSNAERKYLHEERSFGQIERTLSLPETADPEGIEAELRDGLLSINVRKRPEAQPRKISIKGA